jgi:hypothetical protein
LRTPAVLRSRRDLDAVHRRAIPTPKNFSRLRSAQNRVPSTPLLRHFESILPAFIGRLGDHEMQIETTIQPVPREAMIAVGLRIMETLAWRGARL